MYVAAYLCNQKKECSVNGFCNNGCMHTKTEFFAKNPENVELLKRFVDAFDISVYNGDMVSFQEKEKRE